MKATIDVHVSAYGAENECDGPRMVYLEIGYAKYTFTKKQAVTLAARIRKLAMTNGRIDEDDVL